MGGNRLAWCVQREEVVVGGGGEGIWCVHSKWVKVQGEVWPELIGEAEDRVNANRGFGEFT